MHIPMDTPMYVIQKMECKLLYYIWPTHLFIRNCRKLITCGTDGDIRIWSDFDDVDPTQACIGEWSVCVCQKGDYLYVATDKNIVQRMTFPDAERDGILVRFTAPVNHMAARKNYDVSLIILQY